MSVPCKQFFNMEKLLSTEADVGENFEACDTHPVKYLAVHSYYFRNGNIPLKKQCKQSKNLTLVKTLVTSTNALKKRMQNKTSRFPSFLQA